MPIGKVVWVNPEVLGKPVAVDANVEVLKQQILQSGKIVPLAVTPEGFIVDGEHRYSALVELGAEKIPVWVGKQLGASGRLEKDYPGIMLDIEVINKWH